VFLVVGVVVLALDFDGFFVVGGDFWGVGCGLSKMILFFFNGGWLRGGVLAGVILG